MSKAQEARTVVGMAQNYRDGIHRPKTYKSRRAVEMALSQAMGYLIGWTRPDGEHPDAPQWGTDIRNSSEALAAPDGVDPETIVAPVRERVEKRVAKERKAYAY